MTPRSLPDEGHSVSLPFAREVEEPDLTGPQVYLSPRQNLITIIHLLFPHLVDFATLLEGDVITHHYRIITTILVIYHTTYFGLTSKRDQLVSGYQ